MLGLYTNEPELGALRTPEVIIPHQKFGQVAPISLSSRTASTLSTTGSVLALPAHFRLEVYHPCLSQHFSSCGSQYLLIRQNVEFESLRRFYRRFIQDLPAA